MWLILQALHQGSLLHSEELHLHELGIATLTACFVNANRDPKKGEPAKPNDFFYFKPRSQDVKLDPVACDVFFSLVSDEQMPAWVVSIAPIEEMRKARGNGAVPKCRAWVRRGIMLLCPRIQGNKVVSPLVFVDGAEGTIDVIDSDSGATRSIFVANKDSETYWQTDVEFDLVKGGVEQ